MQSGEHAQVSRFCRLGPIAKPCLTSGALLSGRSTQKLALHNRAGQQWHTRRASRIASLTAATRRLSTKLDHGQFRVGEVQDERYEEDRHEEQD